jgi:hypothetical protein
MTRPRAHMVKGSELKLPAPIAEVTVLIYGWEPGKSEIRVRFPDEALPGVANAEAMQAKFANLVLAELEHALPQIGK